MIDDSTTVLAVLRRYLEQNQYIVLEAETAEAGIQNFRVRAVDASAMYFRGALRNFIGRFNITQTLVDSLSTVSDGIAAYLVKENVMKEIDIIGLRQSADNPDDVEIDVDMQPYYPCNKIRVRMVI